MQHTRKNCLRPWILAWTILNSCLPVLRAPYLASASNRETIRALDYYGFTVEFRKKWHPFLSDLAAVTFGWLKRIYSNSRFRQSERVT